MNTPVCLRALLNRMLVSCFFACYPPMTAYKSMLFILHLTYTTNMLDQVKKYITLFELAIADNMPVKHFETELV